MSTYAFLMAGKIAGGWRGCEVLKRESCLILGYCALDEPQAALFRGDCLLRNMLKYKDLK